MARTNGARLSPLLATCNVHLRKKRINTQKMGVCSFMCVFSLHACAHFVDTKCDWIRILKIDRDCDGFTVHKSPSTKSSTSLPTSFTGLIKFDWIYRWFECQWRKEENLQVKSNSPPNLYEICQVFQTSKVINKRTSFWSFWAFAEVFEFDSTKIGIFQIEHFCPIPKFRGMAIKYCIMKYKRCRIQYSRYSLVYMCRLIAFFQFHEKLSSKSLRQPICVIFFFIVVHQTNGTQWTPCVFIIAFLCIQTYKYIYNIVHKDMTNNKIFFVRRTIIDFQWIFVLSI